MKIHFRFLEEKDLPQMYKWLNTDFVAEFWKDPATVEDVEKKYRAYITREKPTRPFVIMIDDVDVGYIQTYFYSDYPGTYFDSIEADKYSAGIDLFIGHKDYIHKGFGVHILRTFINDYVFANSKVVNVIISPNPNNAAAIKVYGKIGFKWYKTIETQNGEQEYMMILSKEDFFNLCT